MSSDFLDRIEIDIDRETYDRLHDYARARDATFNDVVAAALDDEPTQQWRMRGHQDAVQRLRSALLQLVDAFDLRESYCSGQAADALHEALAAVAASEGR
jgi:hypothetical protein